MTREVEAIVGALKAEIDIRIKAARSRDEAWRRELLRRMQEVMTENAQLRKLLDERKLADVELHGNL